jgi:hypothetical protein
MKTMSFATLIVVFFTNIVGAETNDIFSAGYVQFQQCFITLSNQLSSWTESPLSQKDNLTPLEEDAYAIFEDIWSPTNLNRLGEFEAGGFENWYARSPYLLVQNELHTETKKLFGGSTTNVIENFVPSLPSFKGRAIVLTGERKKAILSFLGDEEHPLGYGGIMNPSRAKGESRNRENYLTEALPIQHGHWGGWNLITYPEISRIEFNSKRTEASVDFRVGYQGGTAIYKKKDGQWMLQESHATWIE